MKKAIERGLENEGVLPGGLKLHRKACLSHAKSIDFAGYLIQGDDGDAVINFGKFKGKKARDVYNTERSYFSWIQNGAFMLDTKKQFAKLEQEFAMEKLKTKWGK